MTISFEVTRRTPRSGRLHPLVAAGLVLLAGGGSWGTGSAAAQTPGREPAVVELPASARAVGLGQAFQLDAPDSDVLFYNPALVGRARGFMVGLHVFGARATGLSMSAAGDWLGGGVGVGVRTMEYGSPGPGRRGGGLDPLFADGPTGTSELLATLAYARSVGPLRVGVAGKLLSQRFGDDRQAAGAADLGIAADLGDVWLGLAGRNLGPDYEVSGEEVSQPAEVTLGAGGYGLILGPLDLGFAAAVTRRADGEWLAGGGIEAGYWPVVGRTFVARVGLRRVPEGEALPVTFGGSFWGDDLVLEYAFQPVDGEDGVHRIGLGWR